ncbi:MAG: type III pantothenate kinase [Clostridia bacterium]|nr:type III pantothenate kinase [Clostridia bacterium]
MLLAIDIGNSNVTLGVFDGDTLTTTARLATDVAKTPDQYAVEMQQVLTLHGAQPSAVDACILSSVVPSVGSAIGRAVTLLCGITPLILGPGIKTGLNIRIDNPAQLGADLAAGAAGALTFCKLPCIIIDMGTATTLSVLDKNGCFVGGSIAAGVRLTLKALAQGTAALPFLHPDAPKTVIGRNTVDCMQSGIVFGTAAMLDGLIERMEDELGEPASVVATGGLAQDIVKHCKKDIVYRENLLLEGLRAIYEKNV